MQNDPQERIRQNVAKMRAQGAPDSEVETYLRDYEGLSPVGADPDPPAERPGILQRATQQMRQTNNPTAWGSQLDNMRQGMFIPGLADEASAAVRHPIAAVQALLPGGRSGEAYVRARDADRASAQSYTEEHGAGASGINQLLGALATAKFLPRFTGRFRGVREGATYAGASGAMMSDGDLGDRAKAGTTAAGAGAVLGPVAERVIPAAGRVATYAADVVPGVRAAADALARRMPARTAAGAEYRFTGGGSAPERRISQAAFWDAETGTAVPTGGFHDIEAIPDTALRERILTAVRDNPDVSGFVDDTGQFMTRAETRAASGLLGESSTQAAENPAAAGLYDQQRAAFGLRESERRPRASFLRELITERKGPNARYTAGGSATSDPILSTTDDRATEKLLQALQRAGKSLDDAPVGADPTSDRWITRNLASIDPDAPVTIQELGGQPVRRLGRAVNTTPSAGSDQQYQKLRTRQAGQEDRVLGRLETRAGVQRQNVEQAIEDMAETRRIEADQNYSPIYDTEVDDPTIGRFLRLPAFRKAYDRASNIAAYEGGSLPALEEIVDETGNLTAPLTVRTLDRIKRGLDDVLDVGERSPLDAGGLGNEEISTVRAVKNKFLEAIDAQVPEYGEARSAFAGKSALMRAMREGQKLFNTKAEVAEQMLAKMSASEREAWRIGAMDAAAERVGRVRTNNDVTSAAPLGDRTVDQKRMRLVFPDDNAYRAFQDDIRLEAEMAATQRFNTGGSNTMDKASDLADLAGTNISDIIGDAVSRPASIPAQIADKLLRSGVARHLSGRTEKLVDALEPKLTAGTASRAELDELIRVLREAQERINRRTTGQQAKARAVTGLAGGKSGS